MNHRKQTTKLVNPIGADLLQSDLDGLDQTTSDTFLGGKIKVLQPANGYRFSIDSIILAGHCRPQVGSTVLDLGTGCGIIPLILTHRIPHLRIIGVELQSSLAAIAVENIQRNHMLEHITILCRDMRELNVASLGGVVDHVISNPPYRPVLSGRINPHPQKALARHELAMNLSQLMEIARKLLKIGGRFTLIYPAARLTDAVFQMRQNDIEPKSLHMIFSKHDESAKLTVIEGVRAGRPGIQEISSFVIYRSDGTYTQQMKQMMDI